METTLYADWKVIEEMFPVTDLFIADLKHMDSEAHKIYIGAPNEKILSNLERLSGTGKPIILRIPVIPGVNDSPDNIGHPPILSWKSSITVLNGCSFWNSCAGRRNISLLECLSHEGFGCG